MDTSDHENEPPAANTGYTPGWDLGTRFRNTFNYMMGNMTVQGQTQWLRDTDICNELKDCKTCETRRDFLLAYSPTIRFLRDEVQKLGGDLHANNIYCMRCDGRSSGGFHRDAGVGIKLCANQFRNRDHVEDTLAHEMVHAWDHLRFKVKYDNLQHMACTEIRASNLSGECRFMREFFTRKQRTITQQHQECVRRRAIESVNALPQCRNREHAAKVVDEVWESCTRDTRPFDEIYR